MSDVGFVENDIALGDHFMPYVNENCNQEVSMCEEHQPESPHDVEPSHEVNSEYIVELENRDDLIVNDNHEPHESYEEYAVAGSSKNTHAMNNPNYSKNISLNKLVPIFESV